MYSQTDFRIQCQLFDTVRFAERVIVYLIYAASSGDKGVPYEMFLVL